MAQGIRAYEADQLPTGKGKGEDFQQRYEILGFEEIPIDHITPNKHNPRPSFHLADDDPGLIALGDSIRMEGQHRPAIVYEQVGHYELPDRLGAFVLLQGERRWRSCRIARVDRLRCLKVRTPTNLASELEWLGIEEAYKQDWQYFFVLQFARRLAEEMGLPITSNEVAIKTGLSSEDLQTAHKIFQLDPQIQELVAEYEEIEYRNRLIKAKGGRGTGGGGAREFSAKKAALVYDICEALKRGALARIVRQQGLSDLDVQTIVVGKLTKGRATHDEIDNLLRHMREHAEDPPPGLLTEVDELLSNPQRRIKDVLKATSHQQVGRYKKLINQVGALEPRVRGMQTHLGQIGTDPVTLQQDLTTVLKLRVALTELERGIEAQIAKHSN